MSLEASYCPICGEPVRKSKRLIIEENEEEMREAAADGEDRCVVFSGIYELNAGESIDFSEIGLSVRPETAEVYYHEE